jgi:hypothetical protein
MSDSSEQVRAEIGMPVAILRIRSKTNAVMQYRLQSIVFDAANIGM